MKNYKVTANEHFNECLDKISSIERKIQHYSLISQIVLTRDELNTIESVSAYILDLVYEESSMESIFDVENLKNIREELLPFMTIDDDTLKAIGLPIIFPVYRLRFFLDQCNKLLKLF